MLIYLLVFAFGFGTKITIDETANYIKVDEYFECREETKDVVFFRDPCGPDDIPRSVIGRVANTLNAQPDFWMDRVKEEMEKRKNEPRSFEP